ncbi:MAG: hypothetical protein IRZ08_16205 [Frankia sp.]|nr:hypothetical protein [Frankia sp.]
MPSGAAPGTGAITPYQEALYLLLAAGPDGPTGARLRRCLLGCDPRSVVALADMVRQPACR